jgi:AcrR family transcriptional regulator
MPARSQRSRTSARTFTETARRAQIVEAAIAAIAELGYRDASYAQIAKRAGLSSTGLISYHFKSREELIAQVAEGIVGAIGRHMATRLDGDSPGASEAVRDYIEGNVEFVDAHRDEMRALLKIFLGGGFSYGSDNEQAALSPLERILRRGQREGTFRRFDVTVMATLIQRAIDGLPFLLEANPELDVRAYGREVATVFELATKASS